MKYILTIALLLAIVSCKCNKGNETDSEVTQTEFITNE